MLKRKFYDYLLNWKKTKGKECLLVKGARQVGKTFIIDKFAKENYSKYYYINFFEQPEFKQVFDENLTAEIIYKKLSLYIQNFAIENNNTILFFDEIQYCPNARTALKFLAQDNRCDVIASGSLLGIQFKEEYIPSVPVGYEKIVTMYPLDFEEFLWANGVSQDVISDIKNYFLTKTKVPNAINLKMMQFLKEYIVVGGMPEVVNTFIETKNYYNVYEIQQKLLNSYEDDITQYASTVDKPKIKKCYYSITNQLAKENKKFQYSYVEHNATSRKFQNSVDWLINAGLVSICKNVSNPIIPLKAYEKNDQFKLYLSDIGLLVAMYGFEIKSYILNNTLQGPAKGGIYENLICDILYKKGYDLHYYKSDDSSQEIEFLITNENGVVPVEVKSGNNATVSLNNFISKYDTKIAYKLINGNIGEVGCKITLPLYMAMFI